MSKEVISLPKVSDHTCSPDAVTCQPLDVVLTDHDHGEKEQFEWMAETEVEEHYGAKVKSEAQRSEAHEEAGEAPRELSIVPWQTYCSLPKWGIHRVRIQCDTHSPHSTLYGSFRHTVAGKIALELGQQTIDLPAMELESDTVVSIKVEFQGELIQVAARLSATSGPISIRLGRDVLAGRFLVDPAKRSEGNA